MLFSREIEINGRVYLFSFNRLLNDTEPHYFVIAKLGDVTSSFFRMGKHKGEWIIIDDSVPAAIRKIEPELSDAIAKTDPT